jgi:hypothetical protein
MRLYKIMGGWYIIAKMRLPVRPNTFTQNGVS